MSLWGGCVTVHERGQEALRDPVLRRAVFGAFVNFHMWVLTALLGFLAAWVWATDDTVKSVKQEQANHTVVIQAIPEIQQDIEVLKEKAETREKLQNEANQKLNKITDLLLDSRQHGGAKP
mgnify:FL=1